MTVKEFMDQNDNIQVVIQRPYGTTVDWASQLYEGPLYDVPYRLRNEEVLSTERFSRTGKQLLI